MTYLNADGSLDIYDWKRVKEINRDNNFGKFSKMGLIPDTNFWHYALQLNMYKFILQEKYGKVVSKMRLVVLHPDNNNYVLVDLPDMSAKVRQLLKI